MIKTVTVMLPKWIWESATNNDEFKANLSKYMKSHYPTYRVVRVKKYEAICEMR